MKKIILIIMLVACFTSLATAQRIKFEAAYGLASYSMNELKLGNDLILKELPVKGKITDDFPSLPFESVAFTAQFGKVLIIGLTGTHNTTASRISYKDFSGEFKYDLRLTSWAPGLRIGANISLGKIAVSGFADVAYSFTSLATDEIMLTFSEKRSFRSNSFTVLPQIRFSRQIKKFEIGLNGGYLYDFGGTYSSRGEKLINTKTNEQVSNNWSGYRFMLNLGYCFN